MVGIDSVSDPNHFSNQYDIFNFLYTLNVDGGALTLDMKVVPKYESYKWHGRYATSTATNSCMVFAQMSAPMVVYIDKIPLSKEGSRALLPYPMFTTGAFGIYSSFASTYGNPSSTRIPDSTSYFYGVSETSNQMLANCVSGVYKYFSLVWNTETIIPEFNLCKIKYNLLPLGLRAGDYTLSIAVNRIGYEFADYTGGFSYTEFAHDAFSNIGYGRSLTPDENWLKLGLTCSVDASGNLAIKNYWITQAPASIMYAVVSSEGEIPAPPDPTTPPPSGMSNIYVETDPTGAEIYLDGADVLLTTPNMIITSPGAHEIKLTKSGYDVFTQSVTTTADTITYVSATLNISSIAEAAPVLCPLLFIGGVAVGVGGYYLYNKMKKR